VKKIYYYTFYRLYKLAKKSSTPLPADFVAGVSLVALMVWFTLSILIYYNVLIDRYFNLEKIYIIIIAITISILNIYLLVVNNAWKEYNRRFDDLPMKTNRKGGWIVFGIIVFIIVNLIFSFYLMSQVDWNKYK